MYRCEDETERQQNDGVAYATPPLHNLLLYDYFLYEGYPKGYSFAYRLSHKLKGVRRYIVSGAACAFSCTDCLENFFFRIIR